MNYVPSFFFPFFKIYYVFVVVVFFRDRDRLTDRQTDGQTEKDTPLLLTTYYVT